MEFVEGLKRWIDKYVELTLSKDVVIGKLRFVGKTRFGGIDVWVGVQLPRPEGKHNGTVSTFELFHADKNDAPTKLCIKSIGTQACCQFIMTFVIGVR